MYNLCSPSYCTFLFLGIAILLIPSEGQRLVGLQGFQINDTLWIDGGRYVEVNGSTSQNVSTLRNANLTMDFTIPPGPTIKQMERPSDVPLVSHGYMWSDLLNRAWLFGGKSEVDKQLPNSLWRFEPAKSDNQWTSLDVSKSIAGGRVSNGAGCNVPMLQTGYYLGGMVGPDDDPVFQHTLNVFDMSTETLKSLEVPDFVPVVNQSLVFLPTGNKEGVLVALGGCTEKNGTVEIVSLSSVFIYDISSQIWIEQGVTDQDGKTVEDLESVPFESSIGGIPSNRFNLCSTAGSAQDRSSHNIMILGGQNQTNPRGDAWVLSLPSAIWIKAPLPDYYNFPKSENSCILLNSRYVLMFGGCWQGQDPFIPCKSYGWDPLLWDVTTPTMQYSYSFKTNGYFVPKNVSDIIGGNDIGGANLTSPKFGNFSSAALQELFHPPSVITNLYAGAAYYDPTIRYVIPITITLPFILTYIYMGIYSHLLPKTSKQNTSNWKPWALQYPFFIFVNLVTVFFIATVIYLYKRSDAPDRNQEHWSGGLESEGTWTGARFTSRFIAAPGYRRPPQGLVSVYYDVGTSGFYSQRNFTQRIGGLTYWNLTFMPTLVAVIYGRLWKMLDDEVKRIDKYFRLYEFGQGGSQGRGSLCLSYHSFWTPLGILQAIRYRHWTVALSSTGAVLATIVVPIIQNYVFVWQLYSGGSLNWPDTFSWQVAIADPYWSKILAGSLALTLFCGIVLMIFIPRQDTGLQENPLGLASIHELVLRKDAQSLLFNEDSDRQTYSDLCEKLESVGFRLRRRRDVGYMMLETAQYFPSTNTFQSISHALTFERRPFKSITDKYWATVTAILKRVETVLYRFKLMFLKTPRFFLFRRGVFALWVIFLSTLVTFGAYVVNIGNKSAEAGTDNFVVPLSADIYIVVGVFVQSIIDLIEHNVRTLTPLTTLQEGFAHPSILWTDYTYTRLGGPFTSLYLTWKNRHYLLLFTILSSLSATAYTIFLGSLQLSSSYYGATNFASDLTSSLSSTILLSLVLLTNLFIGWKFSFSKGSGDLIRTPDTWAGVIPYVLFSSLLAVDLEEVRNVQGMEKKVERLESLERRYAFGGFRDERGNERVGVERHFVDGFVGGGNVELKRTMSGI